jgi:hypothetical protein
MTTRTAARAPVVVPLRKRRKVLRRPTGRRRIVLTLLTAIAIGVGVNLATRQRLSPDERLPPLENTAALDSWSDSAGRAALRSRRLSRLADSCPSAPATRREAVLDSFPAWPDDVLGLVACHRIRPGFTAQQLEAAWGPPAQVIPDLNGLRPTEQWDYGHRSVLIWEGQVRSWQ